MSCGALPDCDQVQVCTPANRDYLLAFLPALAPRLRAGLRAGIDAARYQFRAGGREPLTMLFLGSFRHDPNRVALDWFVREVLPLILARAARRRGCWWPAPTRRRPTPTPISAARSRCSASWRTCASRWRATRSSSARSSAARACG